MIFGIWNRSFYDDFVKYGECPAYGKTEEQMPQAIHNSFRKLTIVL